MKKIFILIAAVFASITTFAQVNDGNRMVVHQKNGEVKAFACNGVDSISFVKIGDIAAKVTVKETLAREVTVNAQLPEGCTQCDFAFIQKADDNADVNVYEYVRTNKAAELKADGDVKLENMEANTEYVIYTVSRDIFGIESAVVRTEVKTAAGQEDFQINITELTSGHMTLDIVPLDKNITYTYTLLPKAKYDEAVNYNGDIFMYDVAWWEFMAENYGESDWRNIMKKLLVTGDRQYISDEEYGFMDWDTDHIFYCYGINEKGDVTTPLYTKEFRTPKPTPSDNEIKVEIVETLSNGCNVKVTTSNNDEYVVTAQRQDFIDYWEAEGTETDMLKTLYADLHINEPECGYKHAGSDEFMVKAQKANTDYVLIVFGTNEGPTTPVQYIKFRTAAK